MARTRMIVPTAMATLLLWGAAALTTPAEERAILERDWRISAGVMVRSIDKLQVETGTRSSAAVVPGAISTGTTRTPTTAGPANAIFDRRYDDGFVLTEANTVQDGNTWFWGYDNAAQAQGDSLVFHDQRGTTTALRRQATTTPAQTIDGDDEGWGPFVSATRTLTLLGPVALEAVLGWSWVRFSASGEAQTFSEEQRWTQGTLVLEDTYSIDSQEIPPAPYRGDLLLPGPVLSNIPDARRETTVGEGGGQYAARNRVIESLDVDLMTLSAGLGGRAIAGAFDLGLSAGPTLNWLHTEADSSETLFGASVGRPETVLAAWHDQTDEDDLKPGAFIQGDAGVRLSARASLTIFGRYDWIENVAHSVGPSHYRVDPDGCSAGVALGILL